MFIFCVCSFYRIPAENQVALIRKEVVELQIYTLFSLSGSYFHLSQTNNIIKLLIIQRVWTHAVKNSTEILIY